MEPNGVESVTKAKICSSGCGGFVANESVLRQLQSVRAQRAQLFRNFDVALSLIHFQYVACFSR